MKTDFILFLLAVLLLASCGRENDPATQAAHTDSLLAARTDLLFSNPAKAAQSYKALQQTAADSASWHRIEVFRGTACILMGDTAQGEEAYRRVSDWCKKNPGNQTIEGTVWNHKGVNATINGNIPQALSCYEQAFRLTNRPPKGRQLITTSINLADCYMHTGHMPESARYYRYALFLCDSLGEKSDYTSIYSGLGVVYMELMNFDTAHEFFNRACQNIDKESLQTQYYFYTSLGNCYYYEERYEEAQKHFEKARSLAEKLHNAYNEANCEGNIAEIYLMTERTAEAKKHLARSIALMEQCGGDSSNNYIYLQSLKAGVAVAEGKREEAEKYLRHNYDSLLENSPRYLMLHYRRLERYAAREHLWKEAYRLRAQGEHYANLLRNQQTQNNVIEMGQRYQRDTTLLHQKLVLADYENRNVRQQNYILLSIAALAVLGLLSALAFVVMRRRTQERLNKQMERITELRMDVVRNRVSPHYIFNVLGTILPKLQRYPEMVVPVEMLIDVLRGNLLASGKVAVPLREEVALVRRFVDLHHYSMGQLPRVTWEIGPGLEESTLPVPSMSLQIPVENALKHAFPQLADDSAIHISIGLQGGVLQLCVADNGCGYTPGKVKATGRDTGTGLRLLTRTIDILNRYNHSAAAFRITNLPAPHHGTRVELSLPEGYVFTLPGQP